jgi:hypothetical protein
MFVRVHARLCGAFFAALFSVGVVGGANAATINNTTVNLAHFSRGDLAGAQGARGDFLNSHAVQNLHAETFEDKAAWNGASGTTNPGNTNAGGFTTLGGLGSGASAINGGAGLEVRGDNDMNWGRFNADKLDNDLVGGKWLDSNDTLGMRWDIGGLGKFNTLAFFLIDAADVGGKFSIKVGETLFSQVLGAGGRAGNGNIQLVTILLPEAVTSLTVELFHDRLNDGFGIDGATVANIAPIPVPPAAALLVSGILALGAIRRRRRAVRA